MTLKGDARETHGRHGSGRIRVQIRVQMPGRYEEAMRASEDAANRLHTHGAEAAGESVVSVERYEVAF